MSVNIYIPLCFYFIDMTVEVDNITFSIYIPLCFYFICMGLHNGDAGREIYIPLCFYFISSNRSLIPINQLIYIPLCFYFIDVVLAPCAFRANNLHSTMLLLYRLLRLQYRAKRIYLHSTMLLLYPIAPVMALYPSMIFTFHYASTLSCG